MLKEERLLKTLNLVNKNKVIKTTEISNILGVSLATVRRDLNELSENKKIKKVFGGAKSITNSNYIMTEDNMVKKNKLNTKEKDLLGKFAANLIEENDFIYMDAGTTVEAIIPYINKKNLSFVTNGIGIGRELSALGYKVYVLPGEIKISTDSIIGTLASEYVRNFNFTKGFFGTNGIDYDFGFTTTDVNEAMVKTSAIKRCKEAYIIADSTKFEKISQVTFLNDIDQKIITNKGEKSLIITLREGI